MLVTIITIVYNQLLYALQHLLCMRASLNARFINWIKHVNKILHPIELPSLLVMPQIILVRYKFINLYVNNVDSLNMINL